ncbi:nucleotidyltransferase [Bremerella cremea]|uniref:Nucleotidyltransferase n=1 Tax=Blastopirellula marina TaxID=124 RepID=A0A2S8G0I5_9BACT|nr:MULTISPECIES: nucleotidyltransferase [Pirellulaceae]PQO37830.1 nucleotidyltransferase [Blastopirellula marina]RCS50218.1 nucleotidyltransferase [Bremerella cremea]
MELPSYFTDFLSKIRPTAEQREKMKSEHRQLRDRLAEDDELAPIIIGTFIQGSYRRLTANRPQDGEQCDVDVIVATTMHEDDYTPIQALNKFRGFLNAHYPDKYELQGRSWGIEVDDEVTLDLVPTSAPSEAERQVLESVRAAVWSFPDEPEFSWENEYAPLLNGGVLERYVANVKAATWKDEPLRIPDRLAAVWENTHPLEQIRWTWEKSKSTNGHYVNIVKAIKWWRKLMVLVPKYPKSYPLEHMIGDCCPDAITSVAAGVTLTLESMEALYRPYADSGMVPKLCDRGVADHDVLSRVSVEDFKQFLDAVKSASVVARQALDADTTKESARLWRTLFGDKFPKAPDDDGSDGDDDNNNGSGSGRAFTPRSQNTQISGSRFA